MITSLSDRFASAKVGPVQAMNAYGEVAVGLQPLCYVKVNGRLQAPATLPSDIYSDTHSGTKLGGTWVDPLQKRLISCTCRDVQSAA
jgi:hypothetical protein